ncbi:MAG: HD domain-containing protein [Pseudomonadota bacterium]
MDIEHRIELVEALLSPWRSALGEDFDGYRNHVYRVVHFCAAMSPLRPEEREKVLIAACFHDLGIWAKHTFDYLGPSVDLAGNYLARLGKEEWTHEIALMILYHHKLTSYRDNAFPLVELFRKADWIDVLRGRLDFGLRPEVIEGVLAAFPNAGFHRFLIRSVKARFKRHPFSPLPMFRW